MICPSCREAGFINQAANSGMALQSRAHGIVYNESLAVLAKSYHDSCDGLCDCQHFVGQAIVSGKVKSGVL